MKNILCLFIVGLITILFSGCATVGKDKIETIAQQEVKKEYVLPKMDSCEVAPKIEDGTFEELYKISKEIKNILKYCNQYNEEKKEWIERNFGKDKK